MLRKIAVVAAITAVAGPLACSRSTPPGANPNPTMRLWPSDVRSSAGADLSAVADRDTTTSATIAAPTEVVVRFDHAVELRRVKAYGAGVTVEVPGEGTLSPAGAWTGLALAAPASTTELRLRVTPAPGGAGRLDELEVWGAGRARAPRDPQALAEATRPSATVTAMGALAGREAAVSFEDVRVLPGTPASATLDPSALERDGGRCLRARLSSTVPQGARRAWLAYEADVPRAYALERSVGGDAVVGGFWLGSTAAPRTVVDELDPERVAGAGEVVLCAPPTATSHVQVANVRLLVAGDDGLDVYDRGTHLQLAALVDGDTAPSAVTGPLELGFDRAIALEAAAVKLGVTPARLASLDVLEPGGWTSLPGVDLSADASALPIADRVVRAVRLGFAAPARADLPAASVAEVTAQGSGVGTRVGAARIVLAAPAIRWEGGREVGERFAEKAFLAGWAESPAGPGRVSIGGADVDVNGSFALVLERPATATTTWSVAVRARFPDGSEVVRTVDLDRDGQAELLQEAAATAVSLSDDARFGRENRTAWGNVDENGGKVVLGTDVTFEAPPGAVAKGTSIGIARKGAEELPPLDAGMVNVTAPAHGVYRFLPKGQQFARPVRVGLPYDASLLPDGVEPEEIQTWFYDEAAEKWTALPRVEVQRATGRIVSETTHFTFMINAVLVLPDHPGPTSFNPNSVKDLKAADPTANVDLIAPPTQNGQGTAQVSLPIRLPAGRGAFAPELKISYDSSGGSGWLGVGWDLAVSSVQIDTRFGAPRYDDSEPRYVLDGEQLVPTDERLDCAGGGTGHRFRARVERSFRRVLRCGTDATTYWFEAQDKQGNFFLYGKSPLARLAAYSGPANVGQWYLERVVDTNGNLTTYSYDTDAKATTTVAQPGDARVAHNEDFRQLYLRSVQYTGKVPGKPRDAFADGEPGPFHVELVSEKDSRGRHVDRPDPITSGRLGFKTVVRRRLKSILVQMDRNGGTETIREYRLAYEAGSFGKSRLNKIEVYGAGALGARQLFHTHAFSYWDPDFSRPFSAPVAWTFTETPDDQSITRSEENGYGVHGYAGIGFTYDKITGTVGGRLGYSQHWTTTKSALIDLNGDGLPDRITEGGSGYDVRFNSGTLFPTKQHLSRALPAGDPAAGERRPVPLPTLGSEEGNGWNTALQASFGPVSANAGYSHFETRTKAFLGDADGDGLVDVVQESGVLLNQHRSADQKSFAFAPGVTGTSLSTTPAGTDPDVQNVAGSIQSQLKPSDVVIEWVAPFWGKIDAVGDLSYAPRTRPQPVPAERDGVRVQVYLWNGDPGQQAVKLLERTKPAAEISIPTPVGVADLNVYAGWRLYFVLSTLADFPVDPLGPSPLEDVRFAPRISYSHYGDCLGGGCSPLDEEALNRVEPNGTATYVFDQALDFRIAGQPSPSVNVPATGSLRLETKLVKRESTDDVHVCVQKFTQKAEMKDHRCEEDTGNDDFENLVDFVIPAADAGTYPIEGSYAVLAGEKLVFRLQTDLPMDPADVDWDVRGRMETMCDAGGLNCNPPEPDVADAMTFAADAWFPVHEPVHPFWNPKSEILPAPDPRPLTPWVAPEPGWLDVTANPMSLGYHQSSRVFAAVRTPQALVLKRNWDELVPDSSGKLPSGRVYLHAGDRVYFELYSDAFFSAAWAPTVTFTPDALPLAFPVSVQVNPRFEAIHGENDSVANVRSAFGGGHHLWFFGAWHGANADRFDPGKIFSDTAVEQGERIAEPLVPRRLGTYLSKAKPGLAPRVPAFVSQEGATYVGAGMAHASRTGEFVQPGAGGGATTSLAVMFRPGSALRQGAGETTSISGGLGIGSIGVSLNIAEGTSWQKSDLLDMNGDRVIDVVAGANGATVQVTDVRDPSAPPLPFANTGGGMRQSTDVSANFGLGVSDPWRRVSDDGVVKAQIAMYPSVGGGIGVNFSSTERELADVNGDGLPDIVSRSGNCFWVQLNLGGSFAGQADCVPVGNWSGGNLDELVGALGKLSGDAASGNRVRHTTSISVNGNIGFTLYENYGATANWDSSIAATEVSLIDVTGDGLPDYVRKSTKDGFFYVRMNRGYSFGEEQRLAVDSWPRDVTKPWLQDTGLAAGVNAVLRGVTGDTPNVDTVEANGSYNEIPTIGFVYSWGVGPLTPFGTPWLHFSVGGDATYRRVSGYALGMQDMDGDGLADHVLKAEPAPGKDNASIWVRVNQLGKANLLREVKRPLGGSFDVDYVRTGNTVDMPQSRWVLSELMIHDGRADGNPGHDIGASFTYAGGKYDRSERDFLGFAAATERHADGSTIARTYWNDGAVVKGLVLTETLADADGRTFSRTTNTYSKPIHTISAGVKSCESGTPFFLRPTVTDWCSSFFVTLDSVENEFHEGSPDPADWILSRQEYGYDLQTGNITSFTDLGDANPANGADDVHASMTYAKDAAATAFYSVARTEELVVRNHVGDGDFLRKRTGHYDAAGNLDQLRSFVDATKYVQVDLAWNDDGRVEEVRNAEVGGRRYFTRYRYDTSGVTRNFPTRIEDAHGYVSTAEYDERFGEAIRTVDVNGNQTRRVLDAFGRVAQVFSPYDDTVPAVRIDYAHDATPPSARTRNLLPQGGTVDTLVYVDGISRVIQTQKTADVYGRGVGVAVTGRQRFDAMGRVAEQGLTFFVPGTRPGLVDVAPTYKSVFVYDVLGRKVKVVEPNGGVFQFTYDTARAKDDPFLRRRATVVDPEGKQRVLYRRLDERIAAVEEHVGGAALTTRYAYDPLGELRSIVDAKGNETGLEIDRLGRRTQLRSLDAGTIDYVYDDAGNLISRQTSNLRGDKDLTADQRFVTYEYDLNQLVAVHYPHGTDVKYEYGPPGAAENGAGRMIRVLDDAGFETRGYGRLGEVVRSTRTVKPLKPNDSPQTFETRFTHDAFGRMLSITYPDAERLAYEYDAAGLVRRAVGTRPATKHYEAGTEVYVDTLAYDEHGKRRFQRLGNGAETTWTYDPDTQRLHGIHTVARDRLLQELTYTYDLVGNVKTMTNALGEPARGNSGAVSYAFGYDDLYRLTSAEGTAKARPGVVDSFKVTYQFDEIHNLTRLDQKHWLSNTSELGSETAFPPKTNHDFAYSYGRQGPHQPDKIGDRNFVYDANGNVSRECRDHGDATCSTNADHLRQYFWGEDNELLAVVDGGGWNITRFIYDADGNRVVKLGRGGESITVGQFFSLKGRKAATKHVFVGETRVASKLLPPPSWDPGWSEGTSPSGPIVQATVLPGCEPSDYQPQKCPVLPSADPVIGRRLTDTKVRPETYYYHSDQIGSTSWVTDQNGRVHEHVEYFPYGEVWRDPRSDSDGAPVKGQQFLFSSKEFDEETGLYYYGSRYLDPVRARWTSPDPALIQYMPTDPKDQLPGFGGVYQTANLSLYAYAFHNPVRLRDADGNETVGELIQRKGVEAAGQGSNVSAFGWAFAEAAWTFFGAEHVSRLTDAVISGKQVQGSDVFWTVVDVATLGKGGGLLGKGAAYVPKAGKLLAGLAARLAPAAKGAEEGHFVYRALNEAGEVIYVGITNDFTRRAAEHLRSKGIEITKLLTGLSRSDARAVEQVLIELHGLGKNGGTLLNKINSIAKSNPIYAEALKRGREILEKIKYPLER